MVQVTKRVRAGLVVALLPAAVAAPPAAAQLSAPPPQIQSYPGDPGKPGDPASWRTPEFLRDNGMLSIGAEFAFAAGYASGGMNVGIVDSGVFKGHVVEHGDRYFSVEAQGGETGPTPGWYDPAFNDSHGTHVSGTVGASREGIGETTPAGPEANMHGVAFNSDIYTGNTAKTDGVFYGLLPATATLAQKIDNAYVENVYRAVNAARTRNRGPIRLITSSWGSQPPTENYNSYDGLNSAWRFLSTPDGVADPNGNTSHWLNGAIEVARTGTVLQFTAGNSGYANPTPRGAAPYFLPDLEGRWYTTSGINPGVGRTLNPDGSVLVPGTQEFNQCGVAKWSCVTAPSRAINSTWVELDPSGVPQPRYRSASGTSMAGPHSAAALALVMQRFPYMTNEQALYTMFTTGRQNATVNDASGAAVPNPSAGKIVQVPDARNGWNTVSLRDALHGPGQLLGRFTADTRGYSDVWSNDISDAAIRARRDEDAAEAAAWRQTKAEKGWTRGLPPGASDADRSDYAIGTRRERARDAREYTGSLTKTGKGTLFLTGSESWTGGTRVLAGTLSVDGTHAGAIGVAGGALGGSGSVGGDVVVSGGVLEPGLAPEQAARITDVQVAPGTVLHAGGKVILGRRGELAVSVRGGAPTGVEAAGDVVLDGELSLDVRGPLRRGAVLTIVRGRSVRGHFDRMPEGRVIATGGHLLRISYRHARVTLTTLR